MTPRSSKAPPELPGLRFVKEIGSGGYSDVHLYEQAMPRMRVAVKVISAENISDEVRDRLTAEANAMAELADHPNIVQVFRADVASDGRPYLVMKYYPERNLAARSQSGRLSVPEVLSIGVRISCAVETAHRAGILHRDIKPANILTSQYGEPGLTDFGIATKGESAGDALGVSVPWAPPEVLFATSPADERSDVYSLGTTLWQLLVGRSPFEIPGGDNSNFAMMRRIRDQPPPDTGREDVPPSLTRLLHQTMSKDPSARPPTALSLARSLRAIEAEQRWAPTPLVLLDDAPGVDAAAESNDDTDMEGDRTLIRGPRVVAAQRPAPTSQPNQPVRSAHDLPGPSGLLNVNLRPGEAFADFDARVAAPSTSVEQATVRRAVAPGAPPPALPIDAASNQVATARRANRPLVVASTIVVVLILVVGGVLATRLGGHSAPSSGPPGATLGTGANGQNPLVGEDGAPGIPMVTATPIGSTEVHFSWIYANAAPGDLFLWSSGPPYWGAWKTTGAKSITVNDPSGQQICVEVQVQRPNGGQASSRSSPACG